MQINWRSILAAFMSFLALLAALPYQLGDVATIIPPKWKGWIAVGGALAAVLLRTINSVKKE